MSGISDHGTHSSVGEPKGTLLSDSRRKLHPRRDGSDAQGRREKP